MSDTALVCAGGVISVRVRLTPSGGVDRLEGQGADASGQTFLKARVRAAPEDGAANAALEKLIAKALRLPKSAVRVARGHTSRVKLVEIEGAGEDAVRQLLETAP